MSPRGAALGLFRRVLQQILWRQLGGFFRRLMALRLGESLDSEVVNDCLHVFVSRASSLNTSLGENTLVGFN